MQHRPQAPILAPASRVGNARRPHRLVVPRGRRVYRPREKQSLSPARLAVIAGAVAVGGALGVRYFGGGDFGGTALYLGSAALIASVVAPASAITLAVAEGLGVSIAYGGMRLVGAHVAFPPEPTVAATLLALLPTLAGAMIGLGIRWVFSSSSGPVLRR
jgi:hypothetical protein